MARYVITGIISASIALVITASVATPSSAMTFSDYDGSSTSLGNRADVNELFSGRLLAEQTRRAEQAQALQDIREGRSSSSVFDANDAERAKQRPLSLTLPFYPPPRSLP